VVQSSAFDEPIERKDLQYDSKSSRRLQGCTNAIRDFKGITF
jgi:hypothetical protein